ncbi:hypothetical protein MtrunA17_Chr7g0226921 [Medicago truncatula]|uniref:Transmembrane protein n=1 Tax=Medicago truncatula TaxID=3880 RepID=A0A396H2K5_MEDTR|nr:hypothetical protein MtrunA17_Chr7g0226921 [Medicago truncatula]
MFVALELALAKLSLILTCISSFLKDIQNHNCFGVSGALIKESNNRKIVLKI